MLSRNQFTGFHEEPPPTDSASIRPAASLDFKSSKSVAAPCKASLSILNFPARSSVAATCSFNSGVRSPALSSAFCIWSTPSFNSLFVFPSEDPSSLFTFTSSSYLVFILSAASLPASSASLFCCIEWYTASNTAVSASIGAIEAASDTIPALIEVISFMNPSPARNSPFLHQDNTVTPFMSCASYPACTTAASATSFFTFPSMTALRSSSTVSLLVTSATFMLDAVYFSLTASVLYSSLVMIPAARYKRRYAFSCCNVALIFCKTEAVLLPSILLNDDIYTLAAPNAVADASTAVANFSQSFAALVRSPAISFNTSPTGPSAISPYIMANASRKFFHFAFTDSDITSCAL